MNSLIMLITKIYKSKVLRNTLLVLFVALILILNLRGIPGNPTEDELNLPHWREQGPFELSPERGRYALLYSWFENKSINFTVPLARFVLPDVGYKDGQYVSLFAPGVSFVAIPGYLIGRAYNLAQVGSFAVVSVFAIANFMLIKAISVRLKASETAGLIAASVFLFATPAFAYGVSLYQHHISTFLLLASIYVLLRWKNFLSLVVLWFLAAASIPIDNPNLFMMMPLGIYGLGRIIQFKTDDKKININLHTKQLFTFAAAILPLVLFLWFNQISNGNMFQLSGGVASVPAIDEIGRPITEADRKLLTENDLNETKDVSKFFTTRSIIVGAFVHYFSVDRGMIIYTPVMFFGFIALYIAYKNKTEMLSVLIGVMAMNMLLYAMWGDPHGGWAFGTRYLIPTYAIFAIFISIMLTRFRRNAAFLIVFSIITFYSMAINTLGAVTSSQNPPQSQVSYLEEVTGKRQHFSYERNIEYINTGIIKSFVYQTYANNLLTPKQYYLIIIFIILIFTSVSFIHLGSKTKKHEE